MPYDDREDGSNTLDNDDHIMFTWNRVDTLEIELKVNIAIMNKEDIDKDIHENN